MSRARTPAVAGTFYPADAARLRAMVEGFLAVGQRQPETRAIKAVIAPHAGYVYSGQVAGRAFAALGAGSGVERVVAIGPAHFVRFDGIALPSAATFRTPAGDVPLDGAALARLRALAGVVQDDRAHAPEHALEVLLPFLQTVLGRFALVPLLVGEATPQEVAQVLRQVWGGPETLLVISSDLSHYESYERARQHDAASAAAIERLDAAALGPGDACGHLPIAGLLVEAARRGLRVQRLDLRNSGDTAGPRDRVVGYGAWAFGEE